MYCWYVRNTYLENNLRIPGKTTQCEAPVDFMQIDVPTYVLASREDHIVPWHTAYCTTRLVSGDVRFTLAASGESGGWRLRATSPGAGGRIGAPGCEPKPASKSRHA